MLVQYLRMREHLYENTYDVEQWCPEKGVVIFRPSMGDFILYVQATRPMYVLEYVCVRVVIGTAEDGVDAWFEGKGKFP